MSSALFSTILSPQVKVVENSFGSRILPLQSFVHIYIFGASTSGTANIPTTVSSYTDFTNKFGVPTATTFRTGDAIRLIFENDPKANVYFIKAGSTTTPTAAQYVTAIDALDIDANYPGGFLIAPGAFADLAVAGDQVTVGNKLISKAEEQDFMALLDSTTALQVSNFLTADVVTDSNRYTAVSKGHSAYYFPYVVESLSGLNRQVPASAVAAAVATARFKAEGYKPWAGVKYPLKGVGSLTVNVTTSQQDNLNPSGVNVIRNLYNKGILIYGARTKNTTNLLYRYVHTRVIANVVNRTFRAGFLDDSLFDLIDGRGILYNRLLARANSVGSQLYQSGLLYGATENAAFQSICDTTNNTEAMIAQGQVLLEFYYAVSPMAEFILVSTILTSSGKVSTSAEIAQQL